MLAFRTQVLLPSEQPQEVYANAWTGKKDGASEGAGIGFGAFGGAGKKGGFQKKLVPLLGLANFERWGAAGTLEVLLLTPWREELLYRSALLLRLANRAPSVPRGCAAVSAAVFGVMHLANVKNSHFSAAYVALQVFAGGLVGYVLGLRYLRTGRLWEAVACHVINNACASFLHVGTFGSETRLTAQQERLVMVGMAGSVVFYTHRAAVESRLLLLLRRRAFNGDGDNEKQTTTQTAGAAATTPTKSKAD